MAQRYTQPLALDRMKQGLCPECGLPPDTHLDDPRFWIPRDCDLLRDGVADRLAQYQREQRPCTYGLTNENHRTREDHHTHTEADAGAFERAHAYRQSPLEDAIDRGYDPSPEDYR